MVRLEKNIRQAHNKFMKTLTCSLLAICLTCFLSLQAQTLPEYKSTDNTGKGRQERFDSIENYLTQLSRVTREMQGKLGADSQLEKQLKQMQDTIERSSKEVSAIKSEMNALKTQWEQYKTTQQGVSAAEWREYQTFLKPLKDGEYAKLQQEVEALKLVIRSLEEVIKDQVQKNP